MKSSLLILLAVSLFGINAVAAPGTVSFANHNGSKIIDGNTGNPITAPSGVRVALYWSPLSSNNFVQIGFTTNVGVPVPGIFAGGTRTCGDSTPGGTAGQFQVRAWSGGFATYEQALATPGVLIGQSATVQVLTSDPAGDPPMAPASLLSGGLQGFALLPNSPPLAVDCSSNKTVECGSAWSFDPPTTSGGCATPTIVVADTVTNGVCPQTVTRTWLVTDGCLTNLCTQVVTIADNTPPILICASNKTVECSTVWDFDAPSASDACSGTNVTVSVVSTLTSGLCPQSITRTWLAVDACNNSNTCSQTVTVVDTTPPTVVCASNKTVSCASAWNFDPPAVSDACDGTNVTLLELGTVTNGIYPLLVTRTWLATDACNNSNTCSQIVTVVDNSPLSVVCASNKVVNCATNWDFDAPVVTSGGCGTNIAILTIDTATNTFCPERITRTWSVTNLFTGDATSCAQTVTVLCTNCALIIVTKACPPNPVPPGGILNFTGTVTNLSDFTLTNVIVLNDKPVPGTLLFGPASLAPGQGATFAASYTVSATDCGPYADTLTAFGIGPDGLVVSNSVTAACPRATVVTPGDLNGDGIVDQSELNAVLAHYWPSSPWLLLTNMAGLGGGNVIFALSNSTAGAFSIEYSTNLVDWEYLGPATPRYEFNDTNAPALPQRYYRLRWP